MNRNEWITQASRLQSAGEPFALVTVLSAQAPTSGKAGDKAVVTADGKIRGWIGGGCAQPAVIKTVRRALLDGQPRKIRISPADESAERELGDVLEFGMACHSGGTLELFIDPVMPAVTLTVIGDSPVARALVGLAPRVGLRVAVVAQGAVAADFPEADSVWASDDAASVSGQLDSPFVVVATQGRRDLQGLEAALALQPQGLWFVSSAKKAAVLLDNLRTSGEDPAAVARIVAPAGELIGAQTPEEIALSVLTSVVAARRGRDAQAATVLERPVPASLNIPATSSANRQTPVAGGSPSAQQVAPVAAKSCCGGAQKAKVQAEASAPMGSPVSSSVASAQAALAAAPVAEPQIAAASTSVAAPVPGVTAPVKSSCCGG